MLFSSGNEISAVVTTAMCPIYFIVCFIVWFTLLHASVTIEDISEEHPWETKAHLSLMPESTSGPRIHTIQQELLAHNTQAFYIFLLPIAYLSQLKSHALQPQSNKTVILYGFKRKKMHSSVHRNNIHWPLVYKQQHLLV